MYVYKLTDEFCNVSAKKILLYTGEKNIIELSRLNDRAMNVYKTLLKKDYVFYFFDQGVSKFQKREHVDELWVKKDLENYNGIYYTLTRPIEKKVDDNAPSRLLVLFTCMGETSQQNSFHMRDRMFHQFFPAISRSLVDNVFVMRIMDLNVSSGSHYISTINFPNMEINIQAAISKVVLELKIAPENVVLYGASKGGVGALLHGAVLDYKVLAVDPIINVGKYNSCNDFHFLKDMRKEDLSFVLNKTLLNNTNEKYIFCSPRIKFNYEQVQKIRHHNSIKIIELNNSRIKTHADVSRCSIPLQLSVLNGFYERV